LGVDNEGMSMIALALVLSAGFLHAVWNIAAKKAGGDDRFAFITAVMIAVLWAPVAVAAGLASALEWSLSTWGVVLATAFVHLLAFNTLLTSYRKADFTVVYPVARGTGPLWTSLVAVLILGESVTWLGVAVWSSCVPGFSWWLAGEMFGFGCAVTRDITASPMAS
jgi:drug/metabolite transporter (DMT)-like permease